MTRALRLSLAAATVLACGGACSSDEGTSGPGTVASIGFPAAAFTVALNGSHTIEAVVLNSNGDVIGNPSGITWETTDASIAAVSQNGVVTGVTLGGPITIRARIGAYSANAAVSVVPGAILVSPQVSALAVGTSTQLSLAAFDANNAPIPVGTVVWTSNAPGVAGVDPVTGIVTALSEGNVTIHAAASQFSADLGMFVGVPQLFDGSFATTDSETLVVTLVLYLGRVIQFNADYRPFPECTLAFSASPSAPIDVENASFFSFVAGTTGVNGRLVSDSVIVGTIGPFSRASVSPACADRFGGTAPAINVGGFTARRGG